MADAADQQVHDDAVVSVVCIAHICFTYNLRRVTLKKSATGMHASEPLKSGIMRTQCWSVALLLVILKLPERLLFRLRSCAQGATIIILQTQVLFCPW